MKKLIPIYLICVTTSSCMTESEIVTQPALSPQPLLKSRSLESQRELAELMNSWTCEEIEEFKRNYVFSEVNIFLENGDTLVVK